MIMIKFILYIYEDFEFSPSVIIAKGKSSGFNFIIDNTGGEIPPVFIKETDRIQLKQNNSF